MEGAPVRYLSDALRRMAASKFVLLSGPRQVGKTTLATAWLDQVAGGRYLNWDSAEDRATILARAFPGVPRPTALVLDEVHKYPRWKSWLKGLYDQRAARVPTVVTGSARLDIYQRGGDSLLGRVEHLRLHPFSVGESSRLASATRQVDHDSAAHGVSPPTDWLGLRVDTDHEAIWSRLERASGFPEPYFQDDAAQYRRWSRQRSAFLVRDDLRDLTQIRQIALVEHLAMLLPERVGAPLSVNALRGDLQVGHDTVSAWLEALERVYYCFRLSPHTKRIARAITRERKLYLWDWAGIESEAARFENMVASHLLKSVHYWNDLGLGDFDLQYARDKEKREVDFVLTERRKAVLLVECKLHDEAPSEALIRFQDALGGIPAVQLVRTPGVDRRLTGLPLRIVTAAAFLGALV